MMRWVFNIVLLLLPACGVASAQQGTTQQRRSIHSYDSEIEIRFDFQPDPLRQDLRVTPPCSVMIRGNGKARAVLYGPYIPGAIAIYEGTLPRTDVADLIAKARAAIPTTLPHKPFLEICCHDNYFHLSITSKDQEGQQALIQYTGIREKPDRTRVLVDELRGLWKRLTKTPPAYAYIRSEGALDKVGHEYLRQNPGEPIRSIDEFPRGLRSILIEAIRNPLDFHGLRQVQLERFQKFTKSIRGFNVSTGHLIYGISLFPPQPLSIVSH